MKYLAILNTPQECGDTTITLVDENLEVAESLVWYGGSGVSKSDFSEVYYEEIYPDCDVESLKNMSEKELNEFVRNEDRKVKNPFQERSKYIILYKDAEPKDCYNETSKTLFEFLGSPLTKKLAELERKYGIYNNCKAGDRIPYKLVLRGTKNRKLRISESALDAYSSPYKEREEIAKREFRKIFEENLSLEGIDFVRWLLNIAAPKYAESIVNYIRI